MSRAATRGSPPRRPTVRRGPPKKSLGDRLIAALPVSEATLRRAVTWSILGLGGAAAGMPR